MRSLSTRAERDDEVPPAPREGRCLRWTKHAGQRAQQRAFSPDAVEKILQYGVVYHAGDGAFAYFLGRRRVEELRRQHGVELGDLIDTAVIVSCDDAIVSVQHVKRPKRTWRGRR